jgi:hypothetical protein
MCREECIVSGEQLMNYWATVRSICIQSGKVIVALLIKSYYK